MDGRESKVGLGTYYIYVTVASIIVFLFSVMLAPLAPLDEPKVYPYDGRYYDLGIPVGFSFSAFISLMVFLVSAILFWGAKNVFYNVIVDASGISFVILNYINYYLIWYVWKPTITLIPFFIEIKYDGVTSMQLDLGQIVLILLLYRFYRLYKKSRVPRSLPGPDTHIRGNEGS
ncbi:MAG: hypothetical protein K1T65_06955 [Candidatus Aramenus sp.]|nr:hypothetical protein [Candidatus Aramenus sp.]